MLRTVRQDLRVLQGSSVMICLSSINKPNKVYTIRKAFTATQLSLAEHTYLVTRLQRQYKHLRKLPLPHLNNVRPLILIGSDSPHLITPVQPVRLGPPEGPEAVKTRLGWTLQGPVKGLPHTGNATSCLFTSSVFSSSEIYRQVEKLWQLDVLPYRSEKLVTRSKQDHEAMDLLQAKTVRVEVDGVLRYATPLLRVKNMPTLSAPPEAVLANLRHTEKRLLKDPECAAAYNAEIAKLEHAGYAKVGREMECSKESWFIPHHMVTHNGKNRIVFNCSFSYQGHNLNELLIPGPNLTSSLLGILLRFREHSFAIQWGK